MRYSKYLALAVLVCFGTLIVQNEAKADLSPSEIVSQFNALNSGSGLSFTYATTNNEARITNNAGATFTATDAYAMATGATTSVFKSFCVESGVTITNGQRYYAQLNYSGNTTRNSSGTALTLGAAYLYQKFATNTLPGYTPNNATNAAALQQAIYLLTGQASTATWTNNTYLQALLSVNSSQSHWLESYDPGRLYSEIGNFSVFVMQVTAQNNGSNAQDFVYVARATFGGGSQVPEPATVLLWLLGGAGSLGTAYAKKRRKIAYA